MAQSGDLKWLCDFILFIASESHENKTQSNVLALVRGVYFMFNFKLYEIENQKPLLG